MIKNYLLITLRNMMKNKVFIIINVLGIGVAIACCIVSYFALKYDTDFDSIHRNKSSIYRVSSLRDFDNTLTRFGHSSLPLGDIVRSAVPGVNKSTLYVASSSNFKHGDDLFTANLTYVDPDFFQMFTFEFIAGNKPDLNDKTNVILSEQMAVRLFSNAKNAIGKTLTQIYGNSKKEAKVIGVFKEQPMNSSFYCRNGSAFMNFENYKDEFANVKEDDWTATGTLFLQIDPELVTQVNKQLQSYTANNNKVRNDFQVKSFSLDSFATMAHQDRAESTTASTWSAPPQAAIVGSVIMSGLILLIGCFNLTNTAIATSARRLKEIGVRKVMGSMRIQLITQFISETTSVCLLSLLVGLGLSDLLIQGWNLMTNNQIYLEPRYLDAPGFMLFLLGVLLFTGILAGSYPAFYISKFRPVNILKGNVTLGGTNYFTRSLLVMQFVISLITIVSAIGVLQNARYQRDYDLGFDVRGSVVAWVNNEDEFQAYKTALQQNRQVLSVAGAQSGIFSSGTHEPVKYESLQAEVDIIAVGDDYLSTMDLKVVSGRDFIKNSKSDCNESIIVTSKMAKLFGWGDALGKEVIWKDSIKLYVVGVIKDVYTQGLWKEMQPMMIRYVLPEAYSQIVVNTKASDLVEVNNFMNAEWNKIFPNRLYNGYILSSVIEQTTRLNMSIVYGYTFLGAVAMLLSATGLYTLVSLNANRRMKEIGIRKIVGASVGSIIGTINKEFIIILMIASVLGTWAGYTWCNTIMSTIWKYYQGVNVFTFMAAIAILFAVALVTIGYKVVGISRINPVDTLRNE